MIQEINNWVNEEERLTLLNFIVDNKDKISNFWNLLADQKVSEILSPKIHALAGDCQAACWGNLYLKGDGLPAHQHSLIDQHIFSGNLFLAGPNIGTSFTSKTIKSPERSLQYFPATTVHWVDPNPFFEPRVVIGFDFIFKGYKDHYPNPLVEIRAEQQSLIKAAW